MDENKKEIISDMVFHDRDCPWCKYGVSSAWEVEILLMGESLTLDDEGITRYVPVYGWKLTCPRCGAISQFKKV